MGKGGGEKEQRRGSDESGVCVCVCVCVCQGIYESHVGTPCIIVGVAQRVVPNTEEYPRTPPRVPSRVRSFSARVAKKVLLPACRG